MGPVERRRETVCGALVRVLEEHSHQFVVTVNGVAVSEADTLLLIEVEFRMVAGRIRARREGRAA